MITATAAARPASRLIERRPVHEQRNDLRGAGGPPPVRGRIRSNVLRVAMVIRARFRAAAGRELGPGDDAQSRPGRQPFEIGGLVKLPRDPLQRREQQDHAERAAAPGVGHDHGGHGETRRGEPAATAPGPTRREAVVRRCRSGSPRGGSATARPRERRGSPTRSPPPRGRGAFRTPRRRRAASRPARRGAGPGPAGATREAATKTRVTPSHAA